MLRKLAFAIGIVALLLGLLSANVLHAQVSLNTWRSPESFAEQGRVGDFIPYARKLLQDESHDPRLARVALDLWMLAAALGDQENVGYAKQYLLLEQGETIPGVFMMRTTTADDLRKMLTHRFQDTSHPFDREALQRFGRASERYLAMYGPPNDDQFWAHAALCTDNPNVAAERQKQLKKRDGDSAKLLAIALDEALPARDQFLRLQTLPEFKSARAYQQYLYDHVLTAEERASHEVEALHIENLLNTFRFAEATPRLTKLYEATQDPKYAVWLAWAQACSDQTPAALATLDQAMAKAPDSEWSKLGKELQPIIAGLKDNLAAQQKVVDRIALDLGTSTVDRLELTIATVMKDNTPWRAYLQLDLENEAMEVMLFRQQELLAAYQSSAAGARVYLTGDAQIQTFKTGGMIPTFALAVRPTANGGYHWNFNFNTTKAGLGHLRTSVRNILSSPELITPTKRRALLNHTIVSGALPQGVQAVEGQTVLRWVTPRLNEPRFDTYSITVSPEHRVTSLALNKSWQASDIHYGSSEMTFTSPPWPKLPEQSHAEFGLSNMMQLFTKVTALWEKESKTPAAQP